MHIISLIHHFSGMRQAWWILKTSPINLNLQLQDNSIIKAIIRPSSVFHWITLIFWIYRTQLFRTFIKIHQLVGKSWLQGIVKRRRGRFLFLILRRLMQLRKEFWIYLILNWQRKLVISSSLKYWISAILAHTLSLITRWILLLCLVLRHNQLEKITLCNSIK